MSQLVIDIETIPHECAAEFVPAPDLDAIVPAKNLKDPAKIADSVRERREAAEADHRSALSKAALDWNLNRIVAIAIGIDGDVSPQVCRTETDEADALKEFWGYVRRERAQLIGFCARTFDLPTLIQRSRLLGVKHPSVNLSRYGKGDVTDLRDLLTFDDARYEALMPRSLKAFCRRFGIAVEDEINGAEIPALVAAGEWASVEAHVVSDVRLTVALAERLGVIQPVAVL